MSMTKYRKYMTAQRAIHGDKVVSVADAIVSGNTLLQHAADHCPELAASVAAFAGAIAGKLAASYGLTDAQLDAALAVADGAPGNQRGLVAPGNNSVN